MPTLKMKQVLEHLTWEDLKEITEADDSLCFEAKLQDELPEWALSPESYYKELLKRLKEKIEEKIEPAVPA